MVLQLMRIPVGDSLWAVVDDDQGHLAEHVWYPIRTPSTTYAARNLRNKHILMHREIMGVTDPVLKVDHRDGDGLHCIRDNLRVVSHRTNVLNVGGPPKSNTSGFLGVRRTPRGRFAAMITVYGKQLHLGTYDTPEEANVTRLLHEALHFRVQPRRRQAFIDAGLHHIVSTWDSYEARSK